MQTFLPSPDFHRSARVLDRQRLGKQRVETKQILSALLGLSSGWHNHPAVRMWAGHERHLVTYGLEICLEWRRRGYNDTLLDWFADLKTPWTEPPPWLGRRDFHRSHRSALLRKAPDWYGQFGWRVPDDLPYVWPV